MRLKWIRASDNRLSLPTLVCQITYIIKFEMFEDCAGAWNESKTILIMQDKKTNGYNNILAKTTFEGHSLEGVDSTGKCKEGISRKNSSKTLIFNESVYEPQK